LFHFIIRLAPRSTLFPYTTLFRSYVEVVRLFVQFAADLAMDWYELSAVEPKIDADLVGTMLVGGLVEMVKEWARGGFERPIDEVVRNAKLPFDAIAQVLAPRRGG